MIRFVQFFILIFGIAIAQNEKYPFCKYTYFKDKKIVSTKKCFDQDNRFGITQALNQNGDVIFEKHLRNVAGNASANYSFYENGAVEKVYFSDAPDGGIQFYNETIFFNKEGKETSKNVEKYPFETVTILKEPFVEPLVKPSFQEVATCQIISGFTNKVYFKNNSKDKIFILITSEKYFTNTDIKLIKSMSEIEVLDFKMKENKILSDSELKFEIFSKKMKNQTSKYKILRRSEYITNEKTNERKYFYDVLKL